MIYFLPRVNGSFPCHLPVVYLLLTGLELCFFYINHIILFYYAYRERVRARTTQYTPQKYCFFLEYARKRRKKLNFSRLLCQNGHFIREKPAKNARQFVYVKNF